MEPDIGGVDSYCRSCGRRIAAKERFCRHCGRSSTIIDEGPTVHARFAGKSQVGGLLIIISGVLSLICLPMLSRFFDLTWGGEGFTYLEVYMNSFHYVYWVLAILGVISVVGGLLALIGASYRGALTGGFASLLGPAGAIGFAGLLLVGTSKSDFLSTEIEESGVVWSEPSRNLVAQRKHAPVGEFPSDSLQKSPFVRR